LFNKNKNCKISQMQKKEDFFSSGLEGLDQILHGVRAGDNIVWEVDNINDYIVFVHPFCRYAYNTGRKLIYFRFAKNQDLLPEDIKASVIRLDPQKGFESFITDVFAVIKKNGKGACYVFDPLSDLSVDWYSDQMLENFFLLTCPYLYDFETATYFAIFRNYHFQSTISAIRNTAQIVLNIYNNNNQLYLLPIKVYERHSPTMYMLHYWQNQKFEPIMKSTVTSEILSNISHPWLDFTINRKDTWTNVFLKAYNISKKNQKEKLNDASLIKNKPKKSATHNTLKRQIINMNITQDKRLFDLCYKYFTLPDLIEIGKRMIGSGFIGGKSVGMLLARSILKSTDSKWENILETHDSFFVGSDVFYSFIIKNGCWWDKQQIKYAKNQFKNSEEIQKKILKGELPLQNNEQIKEMLNYFGQFPIIVRSSSLLEDAYGNAFSGKYESIFCVNQGSPKERLKNLLKAIYTVYASTLNKEALNYRLHWDLLSKDEQMALLVQRVSGAFYNRFYLPQIAGVGYSFNPYVWNTRIDPAKGVIRLVFGLGTRAVERFDDDYTRIIALNAPHIRPESTFDDIRKYSQRHVDVLDLDANHLKSFYFEDIINQIDNRPIELFISKDPEIENRMKDLNIKSSFPGLLTFEKLLMKTSFIKDIREMLEILESAYKHPVDIEFTANFFKNGDYRINLLQCRPFQVNFKMKSIKKPQNIRAEDIILKTQGPILGQNILNKIDRIVYVSPSKYSHMSTTERYSVARLIGELTTIEKKNILLIGPGRWGTSMPALGIPVSFAEIKNVCMICELSEMHGGIIPEISLGTHFFNDLIEMKIIYMALFRNRKNNILNEKILQKTPGKLKKILPGSERWSDSIFVIDREDICGNGSVSVYANVIKQEVIIYCSS
jgi:pyruvate,water dikinase